MSLEPLRKPLAMAEADYFQKYAITPAANPRRISIARTLITGRGSEGIGPRPLTGLRGGTGGSRIPAAVDLCGGPPSRLPPVSGCGSSSRGVKACGIESLHLTPLKQVAAKRLAARKCCPGAGAFGSSCLAGMARCLRRLQRRNLHLQPVPAARRRGPRTFWRRNRAEPDRLSA